MNLDGLLDDVDIDAIKEKVISCYRTVKAKLTKIDSDGPSLGVRPKFLYKPFSISCKIEDIHSLKMDIESLIEFTVLATIDASTEEFTTAKLMSFKRVGSSTADDWREWGTRVRASS